MNNDKNKISVIIATFNGEKYVIEQLDSVREQSRCADEVLIFDDQSTDKTRELCQEFINKHTLSNWSIIRNTERLGYYKNFMRGLAEARGEILILCDQDDIWCGNKIEIMEQVMGENPDILSLTTTFSRFDENGVMLDPHVIHPHRRKNGLIQLSWKDFFTFHSYLGMSMAIRRTLLDKIRIDNPNNITHDILLNMNAVRSGGLYHLDRVLTKRRSYHLSTSNKKINTELETEYQGNVRLQYLGRKIQLLEPGQFGFTNDDFSKTMLRFRDNYVRRYNYISDKKIFEWMKNIVNIRYYKDMGEYIKDLLAI